MGSASPGLFGPFVMDDSVGWMGDLTLNYNAEATYYGAAASNHFEVFEPYIQTIMDFLPAARVLASGQCPQCPLALYFPGHILPFGVTNTDNGDMGQRQMGLFASVPLILYWRLGSGSKNSRKTQRCCSIPILEETTVQTTMTWNC